MKKLLECQNLCKSFGKKQILKDVSFEIDEGDILAFIGPNGSGKTTTIKLILGLQNIDKGKVTINGFDIEKDFVIVDSSKNNENFTCASALEEIYKDDEYIYYLPCQKSQYIKVIYAPNEYQEGLKSSLEDGTIKISDLDEFNIEYIKKERK